MMKPDFRLWSIALLLLVTRGYAADSPQPAPNGESVSIVHGPYLHAPRADSIIVVWFTDKNCLSWVEYGETEDCPQKAFAPQFGLIDVNSTRHAVQIDGLEPGKQYFYRVGSKETQKYGPYHVDYGPEVYSKTGSFTTCDPQKKQFSFYALSDIHEHDRQLDEMLSKLDWQGIDFVALDGDMVNDFSRVSQIFDGFLDVCVSRFAGRTPMLWVRGNHETRGAEARRLIDFAPTPEGRFYYSFNHGRVHFIVLDSGEDKGDGSKEYSGTAAFFPYREIQARWLKEDLQTENSVKADYRIALFHMPPLQSDKWQGTEQMTKLCRPLLNEGRVDLVISGHTHVAGHLPAGQAGSRFDVAICSPTSVVRVDVEPEQLKVSWQEFGEKEQPPKAFVRQIARKSSGN